MTLQRKKQVLEDAALLETKVLTEFESREYGFVNKRLPVVKLAFDTPEIQLTSLKLPLQDWLLLLKNGYNGGLFFCYFPQISVYGLGGKNIRDLTMVLAALSVLLVCVLGLILFLKK